MKKILAILAALAAAAAFLCSCNKDEESKLVGTWEESVDPQIPNYNRIVVETFVFNSDGTMTAQYAFYDTFEDGTSNCHGVRYGGKYEDDGKRFTASLTGVAMLWEKEKGFEANQDIDGGQPRDFSYDYEVSGDILTIHYNENPPFGHSARETAHLKRKK